MEVVIGVQLSSREIRLEVEEGDGKDLRKQVDKVVQDGKGVLWITDTDGRSVAVPADKLAYIEIGADKASKRVGFTAPD